MFYTFYSSNQNVDSHFVQHKKRQKLQLQLCNGNFTANNKWISAFILLVQSTFTPSQLSEYLYAHVICLKFTSWNCFSLIPSQIPSNASFFSENIPASTSNGLPSAWAAPSPLIYTDVQVPHRLHQHLSCHSHHLPRYFVSSNFFLSLVFWLYVSQILFYKFPTVSSSNNLQSSWGSHLPRFKFSKSLLSGPSHVNQERCCRA